MDSQGQAALVHITSNQTHSPLLAVPLEVLLQITSNLPTPDYCNLRHTCKCVEEQLHNAFSREFFTKRQFMLTEFSLQALIDISKSRFSSSLSYVIFSLQRPPPLSISGHLTLLQQDCWANAHANYTALVNSGHDVEMLVEAFSNLENLKTVGLRDFNSRSRNRDYPNNEWKSYGTQTFMRETGIHLESSEFFSADSTSYLTRIFLVLLQSLGKSNVAPKHLEVILRRNSLSDVAFHLPPYLLPTVVPVLKGLRTVFLDVQYRYPSPGIHAASIYTGRFYYLQKFLAQASNLEHLRLNFPEHGASHRSDVVLPWLFQLQSITVSTSAANPATSSVPPVTIELPNLRQLDIGMIRLESSIILSLVRKFKASLHTLSLHKVSLLPMPDADPKEKVNLWAKFFKQLSDIDVNLTAINMSSLTQVYGKHNEWRDVVFKDSKRSYMRNWAGSNMQSALRDYASQVEINWFPYDSASIASSGDNSDDEGNDEEAEEESGDDDGDADNDDEEDGE